VAAFRIKRGRLAGTGCGEEDSRSGFRALAVLPLESLSRIRRRGTSGWHDDELITDLTQLGALEWSPGPR